jgi:hypothetical protein
VNPDKRKEKCSLHLGTLDGSLPRQPNRSFQQVKEAERDVILRIKARLDRSQYCYGKKKAHIF